MYRLSLILFGLFSCLVTYAQSIALTESDFNSIRFSGVSLSSIKATNGRIQQMNTLFNATLGTKASEDPGYDWISFTYKNPEKKVYVDFSEIEDGKLDLTSVKAVGSDATVQVKDKVFKLGMKITDVLSYFTSGPSIGEDHRRHVVYTTQDERGYLKIKYNEHTKVIEEILYFVPF